MPRRPLLAGLVALLAGCGVCGPEVVPVRVRVVRAGQPVPNATVRFFPADAPTGDAVADGASAEDGWLTPAAAGRPGLPVGRYKVTVVPYAGTLAAEYADQAVTPLDPEVTADSRELILSVR